MQGFRCEKVPVGLHNEAQFPAESDFRCWPFCDMAWEANEGRFKSRSGPVYYHLRMI